jgi:hypothetical protein
MASKEVRGRRLDPTSKSGKIRELLKTNMSPAEIAKKVGCTVALVYSLKAKAAGGSAIKRTRKPATQRDLNSGDLNAILHAVKQAELERVQMRKALEKISAIIDDALSS